MADIVYCYNDEVYFNLTNKCPCNCTFCIRNNGDSVGEAKTLWFDKEPTMEEIYKAIDAFDFSGYKEAVFCGYGEPTMALDKLIAVSEYMRRKYPAHLDRDGNPCAGIKLRLNTNGNGQFFFHAAPCSWYCGYLYRRVSSNLQCVLYFYRTGYSVLWNVENTGNHCKTNKKNRL